MDNGGGPWAVLLEKPELLLRIGGVASIVENGDIDDTDAFLDVAGFLPGRRRPSSRTSASSSRLLPRRCKTSDSSFSSSFTLRNCSYRAPTWVRYGLNSAESTWVILVNVTGGISFAVGGLCALDAGADVCGRRPVRTIGAWRRVDMAVKSKPLVAGYMTRAMHTILPCLQHGASPGSRDSV
jgi:hypothetical protein